MTIKALSTALLSSMMIKALSTFKMSVFICQQTRCSLIVDTNLQSHRCESHKSHIPTHFVLGTFKFCCYVKMPLRSKHPVASIMSQYSQHPEIITKNDTSMRQNTESFCLIRNFSIILRYISLNSEVKLYDFHDILILGLEKTSA